MSCWEDDGQDAHDADEVRGGPNQSYSLTEAQLNFELYLVMYPPAEDRRIGGPDSEEVKGIKRAMTAAFDRMISGPPHEELNALWQEIDRCEKVLYKELKRSIRDSSREDRGGTG